MSQERGQGDFTRGRLKPAFGAAGSLGGTRELGGAGGLAGIRDLAAAGNPFTQPGQAAPLAVLSRPSMAPCLEYTIELPYYRLFTRF